MFTHSLKKENISSKADLQITCYWNTNKNIALAYKKFLSTPAPNLLCLRGFNVSDYANESCTDDTSMVFTDKGNADSKIKGLSGHFPM